MIDHARRSKTCILAALSIAGVFIAGGCGSSAVSAATSTTTTTTGSSSTTTTNAYATAYQGLTWGSAATVTFPSSCTIDIKTTGVPSYHNAYYLAPTSTQYPTTVAYTPVSNTAMSLVPYTPASITAYGFAINICPTKAAKTTSSNMGAIGIMLNGEALYNPYEGNGQSTPAMSDNVSYTFMSGGVSYTASFIDQCNSHPTPLTAGYNWHFHGVPSCLTATVDTATGPSHIIGIAFDGFPIYGGRDINGAIITTSQLDACNGITSVTPEFSTPTYHYVLPLNVTGSQSSINCYSGTVNESMIAQAMKMECKMPKPARGSKAWKMMEMKKSESGM